MDAPDTRGETFTGSPAASLEEAVRSALPESVTDEPETFEVVSLTVTGLIPPQFRVTLRRLLEEPGEPPVR